jgi:hypothetical protein
MWKNILLLWKKFDCLEEILVTNKKKKSVVYENNGCYDHTRSKWQHFQLSVLPELILSGLITSHITIPLIRSIMLQHTVHP